MKSTPSPSRPVASALAVACALLITCVATLGFAQRKTTRDPKAQAQPTGKLATARQNTINYLWQLTDDDRSVVLSGQNLGHSNFEPVDNFVTNVERLARHTDHYPALLGADYGYDEFPKNFGQTNHLLQQHFKARGLVTISMHPPNPWHNSDSHDLRIGDLHELTDVTTKAGKRWKATLDHVADGLSELDQLGVVVLWRPLHEMNGGWFWWGAHTKQRWVSREEYSALWRHMHDYFTKQHGLNNLIWVYSAAVQKGDGEKPADYYYPGDDYADVVGLDWYDDELENLDAWDSYSQLVALNKPFGLTEFGPLNARDGSFNNSLLLRTLDQYPRIGFFLYWHSWPGADVAIIDNTDSRALMRDPRVITRER